MKYYAGCSSIIKRLNGTLESPAYGVTFYPPNQVREDVKEKTSTFLDSPPPITRYGGKVDLFSSFIPIDSIWPKTHDLKKIKMV